MRVIHICLGTNAHLRMLISRHTTIPMLTKYLAMNFKETSQMTLSCTNNFFFFARKFLPEVFNEWMLLDQPATLVPSYVAWKRQSDEMFCVIKKMLKGCSIFQSNLAEAYELNVSLIIQIVP